MLKKWLNNIGFGVCKLLSRTPLGVLYLFADFTYFWLYKVFGYRLKVVRGNFEIAFPDKTAEEKREIEKRFYRHLCDYFVETLKGVTIGREELLERFVMTNPELVNNLTAQGRSVFIYSAHMGNWEWFNEMPYVFTNCEFRAFYQAQSSELANRLTLESREHTGVELVESHHGYRHMVNCARNGITTVTLILGDQSPHRGAHKHWTNFFGRDTAFLMGPEAIAKRTKQALVYPFYTKYSRGRYELEFRLIADAPEEMGNGELIDRFAALVEENVRHLPELWLWTHRRWKHKHEDFPGQDC